MLVCSYVADWAEQIIEKGREQEQLMDTGYVFNLDHDQKFISHRAVPLYITLSVFNMRKIRRTQK